MLRLRKCILSQLSSLAAPSPPTSVSPVLSLHRLLSTTATFAADDYLVASCGLSRAQARKASKEISHLKSPSRPDSVLAFLAGLGLSRAEIAAVVSRDPGLLLADVGRTLAPGVVKLGDLGLSRAEIARFILTVGRPFRSGAIGRNFEFWLSFFGSVNDLLQVSKVNNGLLTLNIEKVAKPNLALLQEHGICVFDLSRYMSRILTRSTKHLQEALARVDEFGIEKNSWVFPKAFATFAILSHEKLNKNIQLFEKLGWSRSDMSSAVRRSPEILSLTEGNVRRSLEFLMGDVGLKIPFIAERPALLLFSVERRLLPRYCLMNFLKTTGMLNDDSSFYTIALIGEDKFQQKFVHPYEKSIPGLAAAYASSRAGKHQWDYGSVCVR